MEPNHDLQSPVTGELKRVTKNTLIYSVGNVANRFVSFLLIPVYTNYLTEYEVGVIILLELLERYHAAVASFGIHSAVWRFFYNAQEQGRERVYVSSNYLFLKVTNLVLLLGLWVGAPIISKYVISDVSYSHLLQLFFVALFLNQSSLFIRNMLRVYEKAFSFIVLALLDIVMLMALTIWFIIGLDLGLWGVVYAKLITTGVLFLITLFYVFRKFGMHYQFRELQKSLRYGLPLILSAISLLILATADRLFIQYMISTQAVGVYGIGFKFGTIISIVLVTPFIQAWLPILFRLENAPNQKETYKQFALHFVQVATFAWLALSLLSKYLIIWTTTEAYYAGIALVPWIAFSYLLYGLQHIIKAGALLKHATKSLGIYTAMTAILNMILNFILISEFGILGAAIATVLSYFVLLILVNRLSQKLLFISWRWQKIISVIALGVAVYALSLISVPTTALELLRDVVLIPIFVLLLVATRLLSLREVKRFLLSFQKG